ncbi:C40 family peptidase [Pelagibacterales bacterium SAG-MED05]|nr:C40 family peptidase [Pelagibacterales bacterium SAG-MED05]
MTKYLTNNFVVINLYKKPSSKSEVVTQMIYGDSFSVFKKTRKWLKVKIKEDNYKGYVQNKNFSHFLKPTHKINVLKAKVYEFPNKKKKTNEISFGSKIKVIENKARFFRFSKGWISKNDVKPISYKEKDPFRRISIFKNIKYKWGGKSFKGIDCSALIQLFLNFNNKFCPRDAKDQVKYFKKNIKLKNIKKNDIIYWKGHVALALSKKKLIHAYGPMKKTLIMDIDQTIKRIDRTAKLKVIGIKRV